MIKVRYILFLIINIVCSNLSRGVSQESHELYIISQLDLTDSKIVNQIAQLAENQDKEKVKLISIGAQITSSDQFDLLAKNVSVLKNIYDDVYIIPTSTEWDKLGAKGVKELDDFLADEFKQDILIPDNACGELELKEIGESVVLAAMDSKWYLQNWKDDNFINQGCKIRDRNLFWRHFSNELAGEKDKFVLLFTYHPPVRYDNSAGFYPLHTHFLPLPILGSLTNGLMSHFKDSEHATHPFYKDFSSHIKTAVSLEPNVISISGEGEYQMDHINSDGYFININSNQADKYISKKRVDWSSNQRSYLKVMINEETVNTSWYNFDSNNKINSRTVQINREIADTLQNIKYEIDHIQSNTYTTSVFDKNELPNLGGFFFGDLNTQFYFDEVTAPVLNLSQYNGGLESVKIGGGKQTKSIRLEDKDGIQYVVRSIKKSPEKLVPHPFDISPVKSLVSYYFTSSHPFSFIISNQLEEIIDVYRTRPRLMYLPTQEALKPYNDEVGNKFVLFRERASGDREDFEEMGNSDDIISTSDFFDELIENDARPDSKMFLKARFLDILMNDWDRHEDQWRWAEAEKDSNDIKLYHPIPRDRDQAFSNYNGLFMGILRQYIPMLFQLRPYNDKIKKKEVVWNHYIASYLDKTILTELTKEEWDTTTKTFLSNLNEDNIDSIFQQIPPGLNQYKTRELKEKLISRINNFEQTASQFYDILNKEALVLGSSKSDSVVIDHDGSNPIIRLYSFNDDDELFLKFEKTLEPNYNKEVWIYTMGGDDVINIKGSKKHKQKFRLVGGYGEDNYLIKSNQKSRCVIYDLNEVNKIPKSVKKIITDNKEVVSLNKVDFMKDYSWFIPSIAFNSDDGAFLGGRFQNHSHGFKSKWIHEMSASFATKRSSSVFDFTSTFINHLSPIQKYINLAYYGPRYESNYFGTGNDLSIDLDKNDSFYFVRNKKSSVELGINRNYRNLSNLQIAIQFTRIKLENIDNRFLSTQSNVNTDVFNSQFFAGIKVSYNLENFDNSLKPHNGVSWNNSINAQKHLNSNEKDHVVLNTELMMFKSIGSTERIIYGTKLGFRTAIGDQYFYQKSRIGGSSGLRGFRRDRFYGRTSFYHNNNLHIHILQRRYDNDISHSLGISLFFDHGRVWSDRDLSDKWHINYGAGLFFSPLDVFTISGGLFYSDEEPQVRIGIGWQL